jgi:hypothetical protein
MEYSDEEIEQEFPYFVTHYRYHVHKNNDRKPIAKFNSHFVAERFINLLHDQERTWQHKNYYRLVFNGKTSLIK